MSRLKQVVLPAPFGPISAWIVPATDRQIDVLDRDEALELLGQLRASREWCRRPCRAGTRAAFRCTRVRCRGRLCKARCDRDARLWGDSRALGRRAARRTRWARVSSQRGLRFAMNASTPSAASLPSMLSVMALLAEAYASASGSSICS